MTSENEISKIRIELLNQIFEKSFSNRQELLDFALTQSLKLTNSKYGYIYYYSETTKLFELNSWSKEVMPDCAVVDAQTCYALDKTGIWGDAVRQRKPILINDFHAVNPHKKGYPEGHVELSRFLTTPIFNKGKIVAVVGVANKKEAYNQNDVDELQLLMNGVWGISQNIALSKKYAKIFQATEQIQSSIVITNLKGEIDYVNPFFTKLTGYTAEEVVGKNPRLLKSGHQSKQLYTTLWSTISNGKSWRGELKNKKKDGSHYWEEVIISPLKDDLGVITNYVAVKKDITKEKEAADALKQTLHKLNISTETANLGIWQLDLKTQHITWNDKLFEMYGITKNEFDNKLVDWQKMVHPNDIEHANNKLAKIATGKAIYNVEFRIVLRDKTIKNILASGAPIKNEKGEIVALVGVNIDITETKKRESELLKTEYLLKKSQEVAKVGHWQYNFKNDLVFWSEELYNIYECDKELPAPSFSKQAKLYSPESFAELTLAVEACISNKTPYDLDLKIITKNGKEKFINSKGQIEKNSDQEIIGLYGTAQDITEQKRLNLELIQAKELTEQSKKQLAFAIEGTQAGMWDWYVKTGETVFNEKWANLVGYTLKELEPTTIKTWEKLTHPEDLINVRKELEKHFSGESEFYSFKFRMKHKKGHWVWIWDRGQVVEWDKNHEPVRMAGTQIDVTQNVEAELLIEENNKKFEHIYQSTGMGIGYYDLKGNVINYNKIALKTINKTAEEVEGKNITELFPSETGKEYLKRIQKTIKENKNWSVKDCINPTTNIWFESHYSPVKNNKEKIVGVLIISLNISEKIKFDLTLKEKEEKYRFLTEAIPEILWSADANGNIDFINANGLNHLGKTLQSLIDNNWLSILHPDDQEEVKKKWVTSITKGVNFENQQRLQIKNGTYHWFKVNAFPQYAANGKVSKWVGLSIDINSQKTSQLASEKNEKELEILSKYNKKWIDATSVNEVFNLINEGVYELLNKKAIITAAKNSYDLQTWNFIGIVGAEKFTKHLPSSFNFEKLSGKNNAELLKAVFVKIHGLHKLKIRLYTKLVSNLAC